MNSFHCCLLSHRSGICDRCSWPLNQTSSSLVQALKETKAWAAARPRTPLENPPRSRVTQWAFVHVSLEHQSCDQHIDSGFSKSPSPRNKVSYKESHLSHRMRFDYGPSTLSHERGSVSSLLWAPPARQPGCMAAISSGAGMPLKAWESLPESERSFLTHGRGKTPYLHRALVSCWQHAESILVKSI